MLIVMYQIATDAISHTKTFCHAAKPPKHPATSIVDDSTATIVSSVYMIALVSLFICTPL